MKFEGRDVLSTKDFSRKEIEYIFDVAKTLKTFAIARTKNNLLQDKILGTLFFQASTRTRLSFESAMQRLGGSVVGFASPEVSRAGDAYAETLEDTARVIQSYVDVVVMRHFEVGAPAEFAQYSDVPVLNAGDGYGGRSEHPTQALLDLYTIKEGREEIDGLQILMMGDMNQRTIHSLGYVLSKFDDVQVYVLSPENLRLPKEVEDDFKKLGLYYEEIKKLENVIKEVDVIYAIGPGRSRADIPTKDAYRLSLGKLKKVKEDLIILHPLPRLDEICTEIDTTPYVKYFVQPLNGVIIRMALLALVLGRAH